MTKVFITDHVKDPYIEKSILGDEVSINRDTNAQVLLVWRENITEEYLAQFPHVKAIIRYGVGFDRIDLDYATSRGVYVCNIPDYCVDEVADTTIAMMLNITRAISRLDFRARQNTEIWQRNAVNEIQRTSELTLGFIGTGRIGTNVLLKAQALKFQTIFYDPYLSSGWERVLNSSRVESLDELLNVADIVSVHTPLNLTTKNMVNKNFISKMKAGSIFINTSRGRLIEDIDIFYDFLKSDHLFGVALDAIPQEPPLEGKLISAWKNNEPWLDGRLIINPHTAYVSQQAVYEMHLKAAQNALRVLEGKIPINIVNSKTLEAV